MSDAIISANERRAAIQAHAAAIGIDEDYISLVVDTFYANVRAQPLLGPIFEREIGAGWDRHLATKIWLALFRQTLEDTAPTPEAVAYVMERAERIAESLQLAMFGFPGLPVNRS